MIRTFIVSLSYTFISISYCLEFQQFLFKEYDEQINQLQTTYLKSQLRNLQDTPESLLQAQLQKIGQINITDSSSDTLNLILNITLQAVQAVINDTFQQVHSMDLNTSTEIYKSSHYQVVGLKASKFFMLNFLATPPAPIVGETSQTDPTTAINNDTTFEIASIFYWTNPFKLDALFPYWNSSYPVISTYIKADQDNFTSLPYSLALLFNTGMQWNGTTDQNNTSNSDENTQSQSISDESNADETTVDELSPMDVYMENARLLTCIQQNYKGSWMKDGCDQNIIVHPNGKVLMQCNCNETNQTVTLVNDTLYYFNSNHDQLSSLTGADVEMLEFWQAGMFWLLLIMTLLWLIFILRGRCLDARDFYNLKVMQYKRLQARKSHEAKKQQKRDSIRKASAKVFFERVNIEEIDYGVQKNFSIKAEFINNEEIIKKDQDEELPKSTSQKEFEEEIIFQTEVDEKKQKDLIPAHKVQRSDDVQIEKRSRNSFDEKAEQEEYYQNEEEQQQQDRMMAENSEEVEDQSNKMGSSEDFPEEQKQNNHHVRFSLKPQYDERIESNQNAEDRQIIKKNEDEEEKSRVHNQEGEHHQHESENHQNEVHDKEEQENHKEQNEEIELDEKSKKIQIRLFYSAKRAMKPLPPLKLVAFKEIFLNLHDFWNIWFYYKKKIPRSLRFFGNLCKNLLMAGLSSQFVDMLPLWMNVALMVPAILIVQFGDNLGAILFKKNNKVYTMLGIIDLLIMLGISIYIYVGMFKSLPKSSHDIWIETFIIIYFVELFIIETLVIGMKTLLQPFLKKYYTSENQIIRILYISFWDVKVQTIWRREYRKSLQKKRVRLVNYKDFLG